MVFFYGVSVAWFLLAALYFHIARQWQTMYEIDDLEQDRSRVKYWSSAAITAFLIGALFSILAVSY